MISNRIVPARPRARGSKDPVPYLLSIVSSPAACAFWQTVLRSSSESTCKQTLAIPPDIHSISSSLKTMETRLGDFSDEEDFILSTRKSIEAWAPWAISLPRLIFRSFRIMITCLIFPTGLLAENLRGSAIYVQSYDRYRVRHQTHVVPAEEEAKTCLLRSSTSRALPA